MGVSVNLSVLENISGKKFAISDSFTDWFSKKLFVVWNFKELNFLNKFWTLLFFIKIINNWAVTNYPNENESTLKNRSLTGKSVISFIVCFCG